VIDRLRIKEKLIHEGLKFSKQSSIAPREINAFLSAVGEGPISENEKMAKLLKRPNVRLLQLAQVETLRLAGYFQNLRSSYDERMYEDVIEQIEIELKYEGYIKRQKEEVERFERFEKLHIPNDVEYGKVKSLSSEGREKLLKIRPISIGQASRINGVTPADISVLMVYLKD
jgi:tRNA uridine 5-carboxymethylaminomethyl modification enzyme